MKRVIAVCMLVIITVSMSACSDRDDDVSPSSARDYRQDMRDFVCAVSEAAGQRAPDFIVIPQNGHELLVEDPGSNEVIAGAYIDAIDGIGREDLFYGYTADDVRTPESVRDGIIAFMDIAEQAGVEVLVTDYCWTRSHVDDSYSQSAVRGYTSFATDRRELDNIPEYPAVPLGSGSSDIITLADADNFLYLINPGSFPGKAAFLEAVVHTGYDVIIMDLFYDGTALNARDISTLKMKANGGSRLLIAYMSIGEAEDYRYYWRDDWSTAPPSWLVAENPEWEGNYKVRYWDDGWQDIILGQDDSYLQRIIDVGFDGVYLDIIDAYEYFEDNDDVAFRQDGRITA